MVEPSTLVRPGLPEVFLGVDRTRGGNTDITRVRSKRKVGSSVSIAERSSSKKETGGPLKLHLGTIGMEWYEVPMGKRKQNKTDSPDGLDGVEISESAIPTVPARPG